MAEPTQEKEPLVPFTGPYNGASGRPYPLATAFVFYGLVVTPTLSNNSEESPT